MSRKTPPLPSMLPPSRPLHAARIAAVGADLGRALDAGELPASDVPPPKALVSDGERFVWREPRLIDVVQDFRPLITWYPPRRLRDAIKRIFCRG